MIRTRLAPTPSGYLHVGNVASFAITWALARQLNGTLVLRIDDLDNARFRKEYLQDIFDTISFMGIDYDEGPRNEKEFYATYSQQHSIADYEQLLGELIQADLVYACSCSRLEISQQSAQGAYPRTCLNKEIPLDTPNTCWRIKINTGAKIEITEISNKTITVPLGQVMSDFVIRRKEHFPAYQIASLCDDLRMGINLIVRGNDLLESSAAQCYLAQVAHKTSFLKAKFLHHALLKDPNGNKLSKSHDSLSVYEMRKKGTTSTEIWKLISLWLGWIEDPPLDGANFIKRFHLNSLPH